MSAVERSGIKSNFDFSNHSEQIIIRQCSSFNNPFEYYEYLKYIFYPTMVLLDIKMPLDLDVPEVIFCCYTNFPTMM